MDRPSLRQKLSEVMAEFGYGAVRFIARRVVYPGALGDVWEHYDRGLHDEAIAIADEMDWAPGEDRARALELKGLALEALGRADEATQAFLLAVAEAPRAPAAGRLAELAVAREDPELATRALAALRDAYGEALESIFAAERDRPIALVELQVLADRAR